MRELRAGGAADAEWKPRLERARAPIEAKRADHERQLQALSTAWDASVDRDAADDERRRIMESLRDRFLERIRGHMVTLP